MNLLIYNSKKLFIKYIFNIIQIIFIRKAQFSEIVITLLSNLSKAFSLQSAAEVPVCREEMVMLCYGNNLLAYVYLWTQTYHIYILSYRSNI